MVNYFQTVMNPAWYHGRGKDAPFFEGWYYKLVNEAEDERWAIIPGIFIHENPDQTHAFIQVLNGTTGEATYHRFKSFTGAAKTFDVRVDTSRFTDKNLVLDIDDEHGTLQGEIEFGELKPWPVTLRSPGAMGPYAWLPIMECYHGVLSFDHSLSGSLEINGKTIDFTGGRGYIEKDWGQSFPDGYIWQQCNHFGTEGTSLTASIATIPNLGRKFAGFTVGLLHQGELYRFTTYNNTTVDHVKVTDDTVEWAMYSGTHELIMISKRAEGGLLKGPERTAMQKRVDETMSATVDVTLNKLDTGRKYHMYSDTGRIAALEVVGDLSLILKS